MMEIIFILALISTSWGVVSAIVMANFIARRGYKINLLFIRLLILKYIHQYSEITTEENGKPGKWFYSYIVSMNLALLLAIAGLIMK